MNYNQNLLEQPQSITCPNCGRNMRLNHTVWKQPRYVCESFRQENDCGMVIIMQDYTSQSDYDVYA